MEGLEFPPKTAEITGFDDSGGAESGALAAPTLIDADFQRLAQLWPDLSPTDRVNLVRLAERMADPGN